MNAEQQRREKLIAQAIETPAGRAKLNEEMWHSPPRAMFPPPGTFLKASKQLMDETGCVVIEDERDGQE